MRAIRPSAVLVLPTLFFLFTTGGTPAAFGQELTVRVGDQFQANTYTTGGQRSAVVGMGPNGEFLVVWDSDGADNDTSNESVQAQRYARNGAPQGVQFEINTYTTSSQRDPAVAVDGAGGFIVVWQSFESDNGDDDTWSVQAQRFGSDGTPLGEQLLVNTTTTSLQWRPAVASDAVGNFVVVWESSGEAGDDASSIQGQRFASSGAMQGAQFQVNTYTRNDQASPQVAMDAAGNFVVVWESYGSDSDSSYYSVQAQRYASDGSAQGAQFQANTYTTGFQWSPSVGMEPAGDFIIVWSSERPDNGDSVPFSIQGQRYASDGSLLGASFLVNTYTTSDQGFPAVAVDSRGDFIVAWQSSGSAGTDTSSQSIQAQRFASDASPIGDQFQVNTYTNDTQTRPAVAASPVGDFVVAWDSYGSDGGDTSNDSVAGQLFHVLMFADGFESGDTSLWSFTEP